jgi:hypothetical protein
MILFTVLILLTTQIPIFLIHFYVRKIWFQFLFFFLVELFFGILLLLNIDGHIYFLGIEIFPFSLFFILLFGLEFLVYIGFINNYLSKKQRLNTMNSIFKDLNVANPSGSLGGIFRTDPYISGNLDDKFFVLLYQITVKAGDNSYQRITTVGVSSKEISTDLVMEVDLKIAIMPHESEYQKNLLPNRVPLNFFESNDPTIWKKIFNSELSFELGKVQIPGKIRFKNNLLEWTGKISLERKEDSMTVVHITNILFKIYSGLIHYLDERK